MRRHDKEITEKDFLEKILEEELVCRIALNDNGKPYLVPMIFGYKDNYLLLHSAKEGKKIEILRKNNEVCFEVESCVELVPSEIACHWDLKYYCVIGFGRAYFVDDLEEKENSLKIIMDKYSGKKTFSFPKESINKTEIIKIEINQMTGKKSKV
ncbi:MAG TPA: pyridoxamine 5'-phosphate oxidase family protein [Firmicutes bacterium]|nr:pyridoxamine 5'-phosphate oxidase family protein [Bacillota bacterium]